MILFNFGIATEANDFETKNLDQVWIKGDNGQLVLMEDSSNENNKE